MRVQTAAVGIQHHGKIIHCNITLLGRPVLRTTLEERDRESFLICSTDIKLSIHPKIYRTRLPQRNSYNTKLRQLICSIMI